MGQVGKQNRQVKKAVILAAGFGTRFLPASKAVPKVMFPVIDKPIIQVIVEEVVKAGIVDITFVLSPFTQTIRQHFTKFPSLNELLQKFGKQKELEELAGIENQAKFSFCLQKQGERYGAGVAILSAKDLIGNQPFVLLFADEFYFADPPWISQLLSAFEKHRGSILGCIRTSKPEDGARYGFVIGERIDEQTIKAADLVEKPGIGKAPSEIASMSGMVFMPEIFDNLEQADKELEQGEELYHTFGIKKMLSKNLPVFAVEYQNYRYFDTGDKLGYLKSLVELGLEHPQFGEEFGIWIGQKVGRCKPVRP